MFYDRKIKYLDYIENGQRVRNGGFVKLEAREESCYITIQISGLREMEQQNCRVYFVWGQRKELFGEITLSQGKGSMQKCVKRQNLCGEIGYEQLEAVYIPIAAGRELHCIIVEKESRQGSMPAVEVNQDSRITLKEGGQEQRVVQALQDRKIVQEEEAETRSEENKVHQESIKTRREEAQTQREIHVLQASAKTQEEKVQAMQEETERRWEEVQTPSKEPKLREEWIKVPGAEESKICQEPPKLSFPPQENKWKQLSAIYPHIRPFQDDREYLTLGPGDFVILSSKSYQLVSNSFLLHGFYNYKHVILTHVETKGEHHYYIGVPGNFYDREKQVAVMFGFESFECREEPAKVGEFGYYMVRVEI